MINKQEELYKERMKKEAFKEEFIKKYDINNFLKKMDDKELFHLSDKIGVSFFVLKSVKNKNYEPSLKIKELIINYIENK